MPDYPSPCDTCTVPEGNCPGKLCPRWQTRYRYRQKLVNAYARKLLQPQVIRREAFAYSHPDQVRRWLQNGPCPSCPLKETCDTPCAAYLTWYDDHMALARKKAVL